MAIDLSPSEEQAVKDFLNVVNEIRLHHNAGQMSFKTAVKFVTARKFDLHRALALYEAHEITRFREGLVKLDPTKEPLKTELATGKFTVLPVRDDSSAAIAIFTAGKHIPSETTHQTTLQGLVYQLDIALEDIETQRSGIVFIYNMTGSKYSNFDYELSQKILGLLKGAYPARLKKVLIVTAPLWFKAPFKILRLFVREKLRDRVFMISVSQLPHHIPLNSLPTDLGGNFVVNHSAWLMKCVNSQTHHVNELCDLASSKGFSLTSVTTTQQNGAILTSFKQTNGGVSDEDEPSSTNSEKCLPSLSSENISNSNSLSNTHENKQKANSLGKNKPEMLSVPLAVENDDNNQCSHTVNRNSVVANSSNGDVIEDDSQGVTLEEFIQHLKEKGRKGLYDEYNEIKSQAPTGTFEAARQRNNNAKNRYTDVLCYDHSRVKLSILDDDPSSDYINANFVDGYKHKDAFISTQGPLPKTFNDFWRCVWEFNCAVIVMTTRTIERCRTKCGQYWPLEEESDCDYGPFQVFNNGVEQHKDWIITSLVLSDTRTGITREVTHMQFTSWPDYGVPLSAIAMLEFRNKVREYQSHAVQSMGSLWKGHHMGPPIIVHCSAGIGRTGTFITLDISIQRLETTGKINIRGTVEKIRSERAYSIQMPDQYVFCYLALLEYALCQGLLQDVDLSGFEESESELEE